MDKEKGKIIFLNGVTSTGKTTISKAIQNLADENYYCLSNDDFQHMVSNKFLAKNYWMYLSEGIYAMYQTAKTLSNKGINIIIDGMLLEMPEFKERYNKSHYKIMRSIFIHSKLFIVEVYCPLDECKRRNVARGDRSENQSEWQNESMAKNIIYNYKVNTQTVSSEICAANILLELSRMY